MLRRLEKTSIHEQQQRTSVRTGQKDPQGGKVCRTDIPTAAAPVVSQSSSGKAGHVIASHATTSDFHYRRRQRIKFESYAPITRASGEGQAARPTPARLIQDKTIKGKTPTRQERRVEVEYTQVVAPSRSISSC